MSGSLRSGISNMSLHWTEEQLAEHRRRQNKLNKISWPKDPSSGCASTTPGIGEHRRNKYGAKRIEVDNYVFDSLKEARHYAGLKLLVAAGKIRDLQVHPQYPIVIKGQTVCFVELDFAYIPMIGDPMALVVEDVKTKATNTAESRLKRKMFQAYYGVEVTLVL